MKFFYCEHCEETVHVQLVGPGDDWLWDVMCLQCYSIIVRIHKDLAEAFSALCRAWQSQEDLETVERMREVQARTAVDVFLESRMVIGSENLPEM